MSPPATTARPIFYAAAAGYILRNFGDWRADRRDRSQVAITYTAQFFDLCRALRRPGFVVAVSGLEEPGTASGDDISIAVRPAPRGGGGWRYHRAMIARALLNVREFRRSGASDAIIMDGAGYWFPLARAAGRGRRIFLSVHTTFWHEDERPTRLGRRLVLAAEAWFLRRHCAGVLVVSDTIGRQVRELAGPSCPPVRLFQPTYVADDFAGSRPADPAGRPFTLLYAGRVEPAKGVFDLVEVVRRLRGTGHDVRLVICGVGSALEALKAEIARDGLAEAIACPGYQTRDQMLDRLAAAHCVIVPTRSDFPEGFNKVVVEAVLAQRPVVTSRVCPALEEVRPAAVEARPDDPASYAAAIASLMDQPGLYREKVAACAALAVRFSDPQRGWFAQAHALLA